MKKNLLLSAFTLLAGITFGQISVTLSGSNSTCEQPCSGSAEAFVEGGSGAYSYEWSNGSTEPYIDNLCMGTYTVTVYDFRGCSGDPSGANCSASATINISMQGSGQTLSCSVNSSVSGSSNTIYLGYGPQSATLSVTATGTAPFTYSWSGTGLSCTNCASPVFTPTKPGLYTFTVNVADAGQCPGTSACSITICVLDIQAPNNNKNKNDKKVYVCHLPPGNPANAQSICISVNAVSAHVPLHGGDYLGMCTQTCGTGKNDELLVPELIVDQSGEHFDLLVYPNPFANSFTIQPHSLSFEEYEIKVYDIAGVLVDMRKGLDPAISVSMGHTLSNGSYFVEITQGANQKTIRMVKAE